LGWSVGRNVLIDYRWGASNPNDARKYATELTALAPDVILASSSQAVAALQLATRTVPIVFVQVIDSVGAGFVDSLARPGGNTTGFEIYEYSIAGNGSNCSNRSRRTSHEWRSCGILALPRGAGCWVQSSPWRRRSG
jgi:hypothetical protein